MKSRREDRRGVSAFHRTGRTKIQVTLVHQLHFGWFQIPNVAG